MSETTGRTAKLGEPRRRGKAKSKFVPMKRVGQISLVPSLVTFEQNDEGEQRKQEQFRKGADGKPSVFNFRQPPAFAWAMALEVMIFVFNFFLPRDPKKARLQVDQFRTALEKLSLTVEEDETGKAVLLAKVEGAEGEGFVGTETPLDGQKVLPVEPGEADADVSPEG